MAASKTIYYDSEGNKKIFIGDPRKAPKSAPKNKKEKRKKFLPKPIKPIRVEGISPEPPKKFLPRPIKPIKVEGLSPEPPKIKNTYGPDRTSQKGVSKLALKGGGRAYGRNS